MHQSIYRNTSCINISATYLFRLYHNITPTITCSNAQWILWEFKTFWIMWLSVLFLVSWLINKYQMEYQFGLIQLWIYRMFFIEFFFSFDFIFNFLRLIHLATGFGYEKLFFYYTFWNFSWIRSDRNNNHLLILTFFCGSQEGLLEEVEWSLVFVDRWSRLTFISCPWIWFLLDGWLLL